MAAEKSKHLARAVLFDPSNAKARGLLGYVQHDGRWMRPEEVSKPVEESPEAPGVVPRVPGTADQGPRHGRRPEQTGSVVRPARPDPAGDGPLPPRRRARPRPRPGLEASGLQEGERPLGEARDLAAQKARVRGPGQGRQVLEAEARKDQGRAVRPHQGEEGRGAGGSRQDRRPPRRADGVADLRPRGRAVAADRAPALPPDRRAEGVAGSGDAGDVQPVGRASVRRPRNR